MKYRKDIQILRGISVLLVVLFHLGLAGVKSGFLGVDVFFVISGFLMAVLYNKDEKYDFFLRRTRRLLPAYFATILLTMAAVIILTTPNEASSVSKQSIFATFFTSNIGYWYENSYFSKAAFNPLLHLWSLGVEIQFYLLVPLLFWFFRKSKFLLLSVLIVSLLACFVIVELSPKTSFFMMPLRLWEFLIGCLVAICFTNNGAIRKENDASWLGSIALVVIIFIPFINIDGAALSFVYGHPGVYALVVSLSTGFVLAFGLAPLIERSMLASLLEVLGKYSYSIYLVHFPVIVLFLYKPFSGTILYTDSLLQIFEIIIITVLLSLLMYHFVERFKYDVKTLPKKIMMVAGVTIILSLAGSHLQTLMYTQKEMLIFGAWGDRAIYRCGKLIRILNPSAISCEVTHNVSSDSKGVLLVGNSHADAIKYTFASVAESMNVRVQFMVGNTPLMGGSINPNRVVDEALSHNIDTIVLHYSQGSIDVSTIKELLVLTKEHGIGVSFIMPVPTWDVHIPKALWDNLKSGTTLPYQVLSDYQSENSKLYKELKLMSSNDFKVFPVGSIFCHKKCLISSDLGRPFYFDDSHLTITGSNLLTDLFRRVLLKQGAGSETL